MVDLISSLPDNIICYILSFLPSQQVVATSVLSKRWNPLWRSVSSLDFNIFEEDFWSRNEKNTDNLYFRSLDRQKTLSTFYSSLCSFLVGRGDQPLYKFRLRCYSSFDITESIKTRIQTALSGSCKVQILDLDCIVHLVIPSVVFSFKTLVALKLEYITVEDISFVDLPSLKILYLSNIISPIKIDLLLSGCPNLEDLEISLLDCETKGKFIRLPKLVRVSIDEPLLPLEIFKDVEVLKHYYVMPIFQSNLNLNFDFQNLIQLQLEVALDWVLVLKVLNHCPKLQSLVIDIYKTKVRFYQTLNLPGYEEDVWPYPQTVPACISSHLKTCRLRYYRGFKDEFHFAGYILENAKYLQTMKIGFDDGYDLMLTKKIRTDWQENDMKRELSSRMKGSDTCILSFE